MTYKISESPLIKHSVHDESQSSVANDTQVHRQLTITKENFELKFSLLKKLIKNFRKEMSDTFSSVVQVSPEHQELKLEITAYTKEGSSLGLSLSRYGNSYYIGTRGSPTKVLSGQNLVEITEVKSVDRLANKLGISKFEARSIIGFVLMKKLVRDVLGDEVCLFTKEEISSLKKAEIGVYSVGYARYVDFGPERDYILHLLGYLGEASIEVEGDRFRLTDFLGIKVKSWRPEEGDDWQSSINGVLFQKKKNNAVTCQQLFYLKKDEVEAKQKSSGRKNLETMEALNKDDRDQLENNLVRVDNVFFRGAMIDWVRWSTGKELTMDRILAKDVALLFETKEILDTMIASTTTELGLRTLMMSPTLERIDYLIDNETEGLSIQERSRLSEWRIKKVEIDIHPVTKAKRVSRSSFIDREQDYDRELDRQLFDKMIQKEFLDLNFPYSFYIHLNSSRKNFFSTVEEQDLLTLHKMGNKNSIGGIPENITMVQEKLKARVQESISTLRSNLQTLPSNKNSSSLKDLGLKWRRIFKKTKNSVSDNS